MSYTDNIDISDKPKYTVYIPTDRGSTQWPRVCSLCAVNPPSKKFIVSATYRSGEYVIARKLTNISIKDIPVCDDCYKRVSIIRAQEWIVAVGLIVAVITAVLITIWDNNLICAGILLGFILMAIIFFGGKYIAGRKSEEKPASLMLPQKSFFVGDYRAPWMRLAFRNRKYAYMFAYANACLSENKCGRCGNPLLYNIEKNQWYCLSCDVYSL